MNLAPEDADLMARNVVLEAGNQPDEGQQAVASTVLNRLNDGSYGRSVHDVVLAPHQYAASSDPRSLIAIDPRSKDYKRAFKNVQAASADDATDYSGGATHFYSPSGMKGRGAPSWARNQTSEIGGHKFFAPYRTAQSDAEVDRELQSFGINAGAESAPSAPAISDDDVDKGLQSFGINTVGTPQTPAAPSGLQQSAGFPGGTNGRPRIGISTDGGYLPPPEPAAPHLGDNLPAPLPDVARDVRNIPSEAFTGATNALASGWGLLKQGASDIAGGNVLPSGWHWQPGTTTTLTGDQRRTFTPVPNDVGGIAKVAAGVGQGTAGAVAGALSPAANILNKTGNPELASRLALPVPAGTATNALRSVIPGSQALSNIIKDVGRENIPQVVARLEANPKLSLMDVSEPIRTYAGGLASDPTLGAQPIMRAAYDARAGARKDIVADAITDSLGRTPNVKKTLDEYKANIRSVGQNQIQPIVEKAGVVDLSPVIKSIDDQLGPTISEAVKSGDITALAHLSPEEQKLIQIRRKIIGGVPESDIAGAGESPATMRLMDASQAHKLQSQLRSEASSYMASADGSQRYVGGVVTMPIREQIVNAIDAQTGGAYRKGLAKYREANQVDEAFQKGFSSLNVGGVEDFPEYWKAWKAEASPDELKAARLGALTAIRRSLEGMQNGARRGENVIAPDFVRERFQTLFGPKRTQQLGSLLQDARDMSETNARLYQGSKTATTFAGQNRFKVREPGARAAGTALTPLGLGTAAIAAGQGEAGLVGLGMGALRGIHVGTQYLGRALDKAHNARYGELISAGDGPVRDQLIAALKAAMAPVGHPTFAQRAGGFARSPLVGPLGAGAGPGHMQTNALKRLPRARDARGRFTSGGNALSP